MIKIIITILLLSSPVFAFSDVDFDKSSGLDLMNEYGAKYAEKDAIEKLKLLKENYEKLKPSKIPSKVDPIIPKIIHQIWLGPNDMPDLYKYFQSTWKENHPGWEIKVWKDFDIIKENFENVDLYLKSRSYQEASDIARYEILKKYGGLYIDTDIECFANFDDLHHKYDFYANLEPPAINKKRVSILNAMIASVPEHPILTETLSKTRRDWDKIEHIFEEKYSSSWSSFGRSTHHLAVERTMYSFADSVFDFLSDDRVKNYRSVILPSGYNLPVYFVNNIPILNFFSVMIRGKAKLVNQIKKMPETMSIHFHDKENSLIKGKDFWNSLFESKFKGLLYKIYRFKDKFYLSFEGLFKKNFPLNVSYKTSPLIPKVIYLEKGFFDQANINNLKDQWQKINPKFRIKVIDEAFLSQIIPPEIMNLSEKQIRLIGRFYLLLQNGGVFVENSFMPIDLSEFNYKYSYYGSLLSPIDTKDNLHLDLSIIAASKNNPILYNMMLKFSEDQDVNINDLYIEYVYRYASKGLSIVLPGRYFEQKR